MRFLAEPASSLSDAALGAVSLGTAAVLARRRRAHPAFVASIGAMGGAATWGAIHHAVITPHPVLKHRSWTAIAAALSTGIGLLFAASAGATLPPGAARRLAPAGALGPSLYVALAATGRRDMNTMVVAQLPNMVGIVGLWVGAVARRQPGGALGLAAVLASAAAAGVRAVPRSALAQTRLDPDSAYHLAQIPGVIVLALAAEASAKAPATR